MIKLEVNPKYVDTNLIHNYTLEPSIIRVNGIDIDINDVDFLDLMPI